MSAILAAFGPTGTLPDDASVGAALDVMRRRGSEVRGVVRDAHGVLAVGRYGWELGDDFSGEQLVAGDTHCHVAADATLVYRSALRAQLAAAGAAVPGPSAGPLIAAACRVRGEAAARALEGEFAFVAWEPLRRRVVAARDFSGMRPLYYALVGETLLMASTIGGLRALPGVSDELNLAALAAVASMFLASSHETCFRQIRSLPAGHTLRFEVSTARLEVHRFWDPPVFLGEGKPRQPFRDAAADLRALLEQATAERLPCHGPVAVTLSGGWDSPSVYAAAHAVVRGRGEDSRRIRPVSISFPEGDSGREDELISTITGYYGQTPRWLDIRDIPLLDHLVSGAGERDEPFLHPFEAFNRALSHESRATGSRVSFTGAGGDQLFHSELAYLADLLRLGRLAEFVRECRRAEVWNRDRIAQWVLRPLLNPLSQHVIGFLRGGRVPRVYLERRLPPWIRAEFARHHGLVERERAYTPVRRRGMGAEGFERHWLLLHPFYARVFAECASLGLEEGVELRSPLLDGRLVAFAATRPRQERRSGRETKRLLRSAVADILPGEVLIPRQKRTGTTTDYFQQSMVDQYARTAAPLFADPILAHLGIVDRARLHRAAADLERGYIHGYEGALVQTLHVEAWLRAHLGFEVPVVGRSPGTARAKQGFTVSSG